MSFHSSPYRYAALISAALTVPAAAQSAEKADPVPGLHSTDACIATTLAGWFRLGLLRVTEVSADGQKTTLAGEDFSQKITIRITTGPKAQDAHRIDFHRVTTAMAARYDWYQMEWKAGSKDNWPESSAANASVEIGALRKITEVTSPPFERGDLQTNLRLLGVAATCRLMAPVR